MVKFIQKNIFIIVPIIILLSIVVYLIVREYVASRTLYYDSTTRESTYDMIDKKYEVNEYISVLVTDEDMVRIYLNDYLNSTIDNVRSSYYLLDEDYRNARFGNVDNYISYIDSYDLSSYKIDKYYRKDIGDYTIYGIYDKDKRFIGFKTNGVMQYSVFLDENTVEIW